MAGLHAWTDAIGNVHGTLLSQNRSAPALVTGSHYDTVKDAGKYDGALGVITAIAAAKALVLGHLLPENAAPAGAHQQLHVGALHCKGVCALLCIYACHVRPARHNIRTLPPHADTSGATASSCSLHVQMLPMMQAHWTSHSSAATSTRRGCGRACTWWPLLMRKASAFPARSLAAAPSLVRPLLLLISHADLRRVCLDCLYRVMPDSGATRICAASHM